ncbi:related to dynactin subunit p62 [Melanopsichium pennsylvanicum]|uniref:Dynactin subunit 4 n=2 Tax=Melanopsichium pennsylvanicum TaxID=63383 RepID=A0AAJ4XJT1_9BASI|nr:related to dynactin subunit p62 [Melanopsichium pennsylvanicum 4]SNX83455.1 related to dynactin subunit p62 [Melanopsichium pennsylvanicum]
MTSPHVLYYCPCNQAHSNAASTLSSSTSPKSRTPSIVSPPPGLPASSSASRYAFQPLEALYFCDECDEIRCNRCVTVDISSYYCPNCLFEVPGAGVKAEKNRCARNCFECPCCQNTLSVLASDLTSSHTLSLDPTDPAASQGVPPYYLGCSFCRWDSKSIGLVFEKPTGLSLQLQRSEDSAPDVLEFDRLKDHFDPYVKVQTQAAITSAGIGSSTSSRSRSATTSSASALPSSSSAAASGRSARANAARNAATAALQSSKLLRDLSHLAHSEHLSGGLGPSHGSGPIEPDELKRYQALNPWQPQTDSRSSSSQQVSSTMGVVAKREKHRRDYVARIQPVSNQPFASLDHKLSSLQQRWSSMSIADQPVRAAELRPTRVPLKSKLSKRCAACRHIVIKPDIKATSPRFKIKLVAIDFLPEIQICLAAAQPYLDPLRFRKDANSGSSSMLAGTAAGPLRRRPPSVLASQLNSGGADLSATGSSLFAAAHNVDVDALEAGQTYSFEIKITNPLDDPVQVDLSFVRFADPTQSYRSVQSSATAHRGDAVQAFPEPKYIFSSKGKASSSIAAKVSGPKADLLADEPLRSNRRPQFGWQVYPSASSVPLDAFNEVWELEESDEVYASKIDSHMGRDVDSRSEADATLRRYAVKTAFVRSTVGAGPKDESAWVIDELEEDDDDDDHDESDDADEPRGQDKEESTFSDINEEQGDDIEHGRKTYHRQHSAMQRSRRGTLSQARLSNRRRQQPSSNLAFQRKPFVEKGHTTSLYLDLSISSKDPPKPGPLELAMHVTYRYTANSEGNAGSAAAGKDFSFWTSVRLGTVAEELRS